MNEPLFKNKYRTKSLRLRHWDYSSNGAYYITICTKNRECHLGNVINGEIKLSNVGEIVKQYWYDLPNHYANCKLDEFVIMPNHVHGIVIIDNDTVSIPVEAIHELPLQQQSRKLRRKMTLSLIIGRFKMQTTKSFHKIKNISEQLWQRDYFESIIRNENKLNRIREYIINNPLNWRGPS